VSHYLVTGAAGFIGARVAELLLETGHRVRGIDDLNPSYDPRLKEYRLRGLRRYPQFTFVQADISDGELLAQAWGTDSYEAVLNIAARAGVRASVRWPREFARSNVLGTVNLLELCRERGVGKLVQASTSSLYGAETPRPFREEASGGRPLSPYAATKGAAELLTHAYHHLHGLDVSVLRYFTVYGPAGRPDMSIFRFIQWIAEDRPLRLHGDGEQARDFTYVDDTARGTVAALRPLGYELINLGGDRPWKLTEVIQRIEMLLSKPARLERHPPAAADVPSTWAAIEKAKRLLDWQPQVGFEEGLERTVRWYLQEREWAREVDTAD
jgi:nucleoside-diphosphate-sugar epimerase